MDIEKYPFHKIITKTAGKNEYHSNGLNQAAHTAKTHTAKILNPTNTETNAMLSDLLLERSILRMRESFLNSGILEKNMDNLPSFMWFYNYFISA